MSDHDRQKQWRMVLMIVVGTTAALMFADVAEAAVPHVNYCAAFDLPYWAIILLGCW